ncbi:FAD-dependent oxidoreductase [Bordetella petrii]|nr:FAD-dependent oxidoreductase [Bordetella petrii]
MEKHQDQYDVIVVGAGGAGLSAAVAAQEAGARVAIWERATPDESGGNTRYTGAWFRMKSPEVVSDDFEEHFAENAGGYMDPTIVAELTRDPADWSGAAKTLSFVDPNVVAELSEHAPDTLEWLGKHGVQFVTLDRPFPTSVQPRISPNGGGLALLESLSKSFADNGGTVLYNTSATSLCVSEDGRVEGLRGVANGTQPVCMKAGAVILACGGFQGNAEMLTRYIGPRSLYLRPMSRGGSYNKGEGIQMALDIGAAPCGDFGSYHASPMDPRSKRAGPSMYIYPYGILVNKDGHRFVDEGPGPTDETYETVTRNIFAQPAGLAYVILDAKAKDVPHRSVAIRTEQAPIEAPTIRELARKLNIPEEILEQTVEQYNAACPASGEFDSTRLDGMATSGVHPRKSNWARPVNTGPFEAYPIISSIVFTFGGLKTDPKARVLNKEGSAIPGLYAVGEVQGLYYGTYTGATSVLKGLVFGRIAGRDATQPR